MKATTFLGYGALVVAAVLIDQLAKHWVETEMAMHEQIDLLPFFALFRTHNYGIAFSMFASLGPTLLIVMTVGVIGLVSFLATRTTGAQAYARLGFALIIGGAVGNLIDRTTLGYVVDYFLFHTPGWSFAVFNLADAFISVGAALVVLQEVVDYLRERRARQSADR